MKKIYTLLSLMIISFASSAQCSDLFFSEYIEGSSNNKALEIYNPSSVAIDLSNYAVIRMNNGSTTTPDTFRMNGMLASEAVYIIANSLADAAILALADTAGSATYYNGDDALTLMNIATSTVVDLFGIPGVDPGSAWTWTSGATSNSTLVRNYSVQSGVATWDTSEWVSSIIDDFSNLGSHSSACYPPTATEPSTAAADPTADAADVISIYSQSYTDPAGINYFPNWGQNPQGSVFEIGMDSMIKYPSISFQGIDFAASDIDASSMEMLHIDIWTADVDSVLIYPISRATGERPVNNVLTAGQWNSIDIPLSDFTSQGLSMADIWQFKLDNVGASRGAGTIFIDNMYFWKEPTLVYNVADIADVIMLDADLAATNEDALYELTGVVYGVDLDGNAGISFTIIDETAGINIFNYNDVDDYVVTEGDEITVKGKIDFYNGLLELFADSILVNSSGNTLKSATQVEAPSEATESDFIVLRKVWITNDTTTMWPNNGNVELTNDDMDTFQIRIDKDIPGVVGMPVEFDTMTITGLGGQFDGSAPYNEGYQIFPRGLSDIAEYVDRSSVTESVIETRVYPNPTSNNLTVIGTQKWHTYRVFNILGGIVLEGSLSNNNLTVSDLHTGTYIVKLYAGENTGVARFVVNR
jgi:hypothetical protein